MRTLAGVVLYLVQHGQATSEAEDPRRQLTDRGADDVDRTARLAIGWLGDRPSRVIHSGKTRARQTAEIWAALLGIAAEDGDGLAPNDDPSAWVDRLADGTLGVMLVGHLPHLGRLAAALVTGDSSRQVVSFHQGGLVALQRADSGWLVALAIPPPPSSGPGGA